MTVTTFENLLERFDRGEEVLDYFDVEGAVVEDPGTVAEAVSVVLPHGLLSAYDAEAERRGVGRGAILSVALAEWMENRNSHAVA